MTTGGESSASTFALEAAAGLAVPHALHVVRIFRLSSVQLEHTQLAVAAVAALIFGAIRSSLALAACSRASSDLKWRQTAQRCSCGSLTSVQAAQFQLGGGVSAAAA